LNYVQDVIVHKQDESYINEFGLIPMFCIWAVIHTGLYRSSSLQNVPTPM